MNENDIERIRNLMNFYDRPDQAKRYLEAQTNKQSLNKEFSVVFSNLPHDYDNKKVMALDIGCNSGRYVAELLVRGIETIGIDITIFPLKVASESLGARFARASATALPFKKYCFDIIICIELLHHLTDDGLISALSQINYTLKPGGLFIFDIKNKSNFVLRRTYEKGDNDAFTLRARTISEMTELIQQCGLEIKKKRGIFFPIALFAPYVVVFAEKNKK